MQIALINTNRMQPPIAPIGLDYVAEALKRAGYKQLEDGSFAGRVPGCVGLVVFADSRSACEEELHSTMEEWILLGLKLGHSLPVIGGIDLNNEPVLEPVDAL